jgi:hypothetical protein
MKHLIRLLILAAALCVVASAAELTLSWKDNANNEAGFAIERAPVADAGAVGTFAEIAIVGPDVQSWTDIGLPNNTVFAYRVRAFNQGGFSAFTKVATGRTVEPAPAAPTDAVVVTVTVSIAVTPPKP